MTQILRLKSLLIVLAIMPSSLSTLGIINSPIALAASCSENASSDQQATQQMECVDKFQKDCKKQGFPAGFCNNLSVQDVNKCANNGNQYTLKKPCLEDLKKAWDKNGGDNSEPDSSNLGVTHNGDDCSADSVDKLDKSNCGIIKWIVIFTNVLAGLAGTVIVAMIIWGGIQYSMAGPDPSKVQAAKKKIMSALTALLLLIFGFSIIQWLVPGGLL